MQTVGKRTTTNRTVVPKIKLPVEFNVQLPPCDRYTLSNGVEVFWIDMGGEDTLMLNWVFYAGNWFEKKTLGGAKAVQAERLFFIKIHGTTLRRNLIHRCVFG